MLAIKITSLKNFMNHLLLADTFDICLLEEATIATSNTFTLDGRINKAFYTQEELSDAQSCPYEFSFWKNIKGICLQLIRGKKTPTYFKFVLHLIPDQIVAFLESYTSEKVSIGDLHQIKAFVLTIKYQNDMATLTTGTAYHSFVMDKSLDLLWDKAILQYLSKQEIIFEQMV